MHFDKPLSTPHSRFATKCDGSSHDLFSSACIPTLFPFPLLMLEAKKGKNEEAKARTRSPKKQGSPHARKGGNNAKEIPSHRRHFDRFNRTCYTCSKSTRGHTCIMSGQGPSGASGSGGAVSSGAPAAAAAASVSAPQQATVLTSAQASQLLQKLRTLNSAGGAGGEGGAGQTIKIQAVQTNPATGVRQIIAIPIQAASAGAGGAGAAHVVTSAALGVQGKISVGIQD